MRIHLIAVGGSVMHNIAIALHKRGHEVTGSDDEIFDPAKKNLSFYDLLPNELGWHPEKITEEIEAIILGMHARQDNPELKKARELGIRIYSFPEFVYEECKEKKRVVVAGSHGKTTITAMVMHVLNENESDFDYLVGAPVENFDDSVRLTKNAPVAIIEGDEYLSSPADRTPKFLHYKPTIAIITGMAWDHMNVFPTYEEYKAQFEEFIESMLPGSKLIYNAEDEEVTELTKKARSTVKLIPYKTPRYDIRDNQMVLRTIFRNFPLEIYGKHNMANIEGARLICKELGIDDMTFYQAISSFAGAGKRLELVEEEGDTRIFRDFAHAPSKVKASISGLKEQFPFERLLAVLELHTYSSMNEEFLPQYKGTTEQADKVFIFLNPEAAKAKDLDPINEEKIKENFDRYDIEVFYDRDKLESAISEESLAETTLLFMSSGNFNGLDLQQFSNDLVY